MIGWLKRFDDMYFEKQKGLIYTKGDKVCCYILLVIFFGALGYNISKSSFDLLSTIIFFGAGGTLLLIRKQAKKRGGVK
jgi:hypothetical protein